MATTQNVPIDVSVVDAVAPSADAAATRPAALPKNVCPPVATTTAGDSPDLTTDPA